MIRAFSVFYVIFSTVGCGPVNETRCHQSTTNVGLVDCIRDGRSLTEGQFANSTPGQRDQLKVFVASPRSAPVPLGFRRISLDDDITALVSEEPEKGHGLYFLRQQVGPIIQIPHCYFDRNTLSVGRALFEATGARALMVNSVHRYNGSGCDIGDFRCQSDVTRNTDSSFHAVHAGLMDVSDDSVVVAVHGFAPRGGLDPDVIMSAAGSDLDLRCFENAFRGDPIRAEVARFPRDIQILGGLRGVQAQDVRRRGRSMLHLELSSAFRHALRESKPLRTRLAQRIGACL